MALSTMGIKKAKPREKDYKMYDEGGLYLLVRAKGKKTWRTRFQTEGKDRSRTLGNYPEMSLAEARVAAQKFNVQTHDLGLGEEVQTFKLVAERYIESQKDNWSKAHFNRQNGMLKKWLLPEIGDTEISEIRPRRILSILRIAEKQGKGETARRINMLASSVFRLAFIEELIENNPCVDLVHALKPVPKVKNMARVPLSEVGQLVHDIQNYSGMKSTTLFGLFAMHTWVRTKEARFAEWREVDLEKKLWTIPKEKMKMSRDHIIPLSDQAIELLPKIKLSTRIGGRRIKTKYLFPDFTKSGVVSENRILNMLKGLGYEGRQTGHGFRGLASTWANENGYDPEVIELSLAHVDSNQVRAAYNHAQRMPEREKLMQDWSNWLDSEAAKIKT